MTRWQRGAAGIERVLAQVAMGVANDLTDAADQLLPRLGLFG
jgi:hypothetical protein